MQIFTSDNINVVLGIMGTVPFPIPRLPFAEEGISALAVVDCIQAHDGEKSMEPISTSSNFKEREALHHLWVQLALRQRNVHT